MLVHRAYFHDAHQSLRLDYAYLRTVPNSVFERTDLRALSLVGNQLKALSPRIGMLQQLRALDLSGNQLSELPDTFAQLIQLEALVLSTNQFQTFPDVLCQLPNLKFLQLKGNKLTSLPERIRELQGLCILDLAFNPLTTLPEGLAELPALTNLICTSNAFKTFPKVLLLMPQLQHPENLDLAFRLHLPTVQLQLLFQLLRQLERQRMGWPMRWVLFQLLFDRPLSSDQRPAALPLLVLPNRRLRRRLHAYLTQGQSPLQPQSRLHLLGQPQQLDTQWLYQHPQYAPTPAEATHFILGHSITKTLLHSLPDAPQFVTEHQAQQHWAPLQRRPWLEEERDHLVELLLSGQEASMALALELIRDSTLVRDLANELLLAYTLLPTTARETRTVMKRIFARALPQFDPQHLPHPSFVFYKYSSHMEANGYPYSSTKSEQQITKSIIRYTHGVAYWEGGALAQLLFEQTGNGYDYLLHFLPLEVLQEWLQQFREGEDTLCLSALVAMKALPRLDPTHWAGIRRLDLRGCAFRRAPDLQQLQALPQLEEIDLRHNPIRYLPRATLAEFAMYRVFISK